MQTLLLLSILAQAPAVSVTPRPADVTLTEHAFSDGHRRFKLYESASLVAEPSPTAELREQLLALDAKLVIDRPTMRVWKVKDARALRQKFPTLRPAFHDVKSGAGRFRVPLGLVCGGVREAASWQDVLARSGAGCLPDFWYPPTLR